jgi:hypothetical protein
MPLGLFGLLRSPSGSYYPPIDGYTLYCWKLDESSAPWANSGAAGTLDMSVASGASVSSPTGVYNKAISNSSGKGITTGASSVGESLITNQFTGSCWVRISSYSPNATFFSKSYDDGYWVYPFTSVIMALGIDNTGSWYCGVTIGGTRYFVNVTSASYRIPLNVKTFISYTYDGTFIKAYFNGTLAGTYDITQNYNVTKSTGASITTGTTDTGLHTDDGTATLTLPFSFTIYDTAYTTLKLCSNGNLQFTTNQSATSGNVPNASHGTAIFALFSDQVTSYNPSGPNGIFSLTTGTTPNRVYTLEFRTSMYSQTTGRFYYNLILYEASPTHFDFIYGTWNGLGTKPSGSIGVQRENGANMPIQFTAIHTQTSTPIPDSGTKYAFAYGAPATTTIDWGNHGSWYITSNANTERINGYVDDVRIENVVRDASYFLNIYNATPHT